MEWIDVNVCMPPEGKYVIAKHNRETWRDSTDQENVNTVVVKLIRGLSKEDRKKMERGLIKSPKEKRYIWKGNHYEMTETERWKVYRIEDEDGNNLKPYYWDAFGPDKFDGQEITHWCKIPQLK